MKLIIGFIIAFILITISSHVPHEWVWLVYLACAINGVFIGWFAFE